MVQDRILVIDCQIAGISGDMILGALIDLGVNADKVRDVMSLSGKYLKGIKSLDIEIKDVKRKGFRAKRVEVKAHEDYDHRKGIEVKESILKCINDLNLQIDARNFALNVINTLIDAEAKIHGESAQDVHLHELGSVDTVADIIGTAFCLDDLGLFNNTRIYSTPVAIGGGTFRSLEGILSSPSPAVVEILKSKNFSMIGGPINAELCTPTGASILVNMAESIDYYPLIKPSIVGYGAGSNDFEEFPNILRMTLGEAIPEFLSDEVSLIETNVDDVTGEVIGYSIDKLMKEGAKSVSIIPIYTKGNRPGQIIQIIADHGKVEHLSRVLMEETGTLGVRIIPCKRHILLRDFFDVKIKLDGIEKTIRIKIAKDGKGKIVRIKPEYEDAKKIADELGLPLREILVLAEERARATLFKETKS
ncbi:MAG: nickel pincer cofactor biosynthesis protein LarC [archaeon]|nr:nickel pincer cofactor biosynthesis protein LarC [archaeon]MCP8314635.1 nickel pincer cofactor biosynthesis protein LarC [archaeon]MCP8317390.1 nickel pincer cofactor biosynthesis protein LarC [archaeon]MCP8320447.1 nickel pincer cofactor biosynthesis protein LarC [archaeon]